MNEVARNRAVAAAWAMTIALASSPSLATDATPRTHGFQGEGPGYVPFLDAISTSVPPTATQRAAADKIAATIRWNRQGTPKVIFNRNGYLSPAQSGEPDAIARQFLHHNAGLFGLSASTIDGMETLRVSPLHESPEYLRMLQGETVSTENVPHVVLFRQVFAGLSAGGREGLVTVGIARDGRVAFVGSTLSRETRLNSTSASLSMIDALNIAAADVDMNLGALDIIENVGIAGDAFNVFSSSVLDDVQRVRVRALPIPGQGVRRVYEVTLLDSSHERGHPQAFISHIDAETGRVWVRDNAVQHLADGVDVTKATQASYGQFAGSTPAGDCGEHHAFAIDEGNGLLQITAHATTADDITLDLFYQGSHVASQDLLTSEVLAYQPSGGVPAGDYSVVVCPYDGAAAPAFDYNGVYSASPGAPVSLSGLPSPAWNIFPNSPVPGRFGPEDVAIGTDTRENWCWLVSGDSLDDNETGRPPEECARALSNVASRLPWDSISAGLPTFTTHGNNASTAVSHVNFVAPDTVFFRPASAERNYDFEFTNAWFDSACDPTVFADPTRNFGDFEAATTNLFAMHNRMHDWSYLLGFTEVNSNLQFNNFGLTGPLRQNDGEIGSSQAGRLTVNGRDNANQISLQDGVPGITNQYLWQSLSGAIYSPGCVDGAFDMVIIGHEYTHAISNRMTGGPDATLGGDHAGSMGEAWSDLAALEYVTSYGFAPVGQESPYAMAVYATGDPEAGIRNYGIDNSPLNFSNFDYDGNGAGSPHANSELWGAANYQIRQALIDRYQADYPYEDKELQAACADGKYNSARCPGNRRWIQLMFDGLLLQPAAATMLDARDAILAADLLRYDGANQDILWDAFAYRGMGANAFAADGGDNNPLPDFASPLRNDNAEIRFNVVGTDGSAPVAKVFTGQYEARITPTADSDPATDNIGETMAYVPGEYEFIVQAEGYGAQRFTLTIEAGQNREVTFPLRPNMASQFRGAVASGDGDSEQALLNLIDDTENTNWASTDPAGTASEGKGEGAYVEGRQVTVQLAERTQVRDVQVSAMLNGNNRFTALRSFDLRACDATVTDCSDDSNFSAWFASADDAFDGRFLRPKTPHLMLKNFEVPEVTATHVQIVVRDNQCTGGPDFQGDDPLQASNDPTNDPDCDSGNNLTLALLETDGDLVKVNQGLSVRIAELQVFGEKATTAQSRNASATTTTSRNLAVTRGGATGLLVLLMMLPLFGRRRG